MITKQVLHLKFCSTLPHLPSECLAQHFEKATRICCLRFCWFVCLLACLFIFHRPLRWILKYKDSKLITGLYSYWKIYFIDILTLKIFSSWNMKYFFFLHSSLNTIKLYKGLFSTLFFNLLCSLSHQLAFQHSHQHSEKHKITRNRKTKNLIVFRISSMLFSYE